MYFGIKLQIGSLVIKRCRPLFYELKVSRVPRERLWRTTGGTRTTVWEPLI